MMKHFPGIVVQILNMTGVTVEVKLPNLQNITVGLYTTNLVHG